MTPLSMLILCIVLANVAAVAVILYAVIDTKRPPDRRNSV